MARERLILALPLCFVLMSARQAEAQRAYFDGSWQSNYTMCPVDGTLVTVLNSYAGYYTDPNEPYPKTGDLGYVRAVAANVAPCVSDAPGFDFFLPEGASLAISASNPVYRIRGRFSDGYWEYVPNDANGGCSQSPQAGAYGGYFFGWSALPPGWYLDVRVPVVYYKKLLGLGGPSTHRLSLVTSSTYGNLTPFQPITVFYEPEFLDLASNNVTSTSASLAFDLRSYYHDGLLYIDYGTTPSFGMSLPAVNVSSTGLEYPVNANLTGLTPGTAHYWRARYVTTSGTFTSPTQLVPEPSAVASAIAASVALALRFRRGGARADRAGRARAQRARRSRGGAVVAREARYASRADGDLLGPDSQAHAPVVGSPARRADAPRPSAPARDAADAHPARCAREPLAARRTLAAAVREQAQRAGPREPPRLRGPGGLLGRAAAHALGPGVAARAVRAQARRRHTPPWRVCHGGHA